MPVRSAAGERDAAANRRRPRRGNPTDHAHRSRERHRTMSRKNYTARSPGAAPNR